jgi:hypothetical protein
MPKPVQGQWLRDHRLAGWLGGRQEVRLENISKPRRWSFAGYGAAAVGMRRRITAPAARFKPATAAAGELYKHPGGRFRSGELLGRLVVLLPIQRHRNQFELLRRLRPRRRSSTTDAGHLHEHEDGRSCTGRVFRRLVLHAAIQRSPDVHKLSLILPPPVFRPGPVASSSLCGAGS